MSTPQTLPGTVKHQVIAGFTQAAGRYDEGGTEFFTAMGTRLVDLADVRPGARVLDVGCGKGAVTLPAARLAGEHRPRLCHRPGRPDAGRRSSAGPRLRAGHHHRYARRRRRPAVRGRDLRRHPGRVCDPAPAAASTGRAALAGPAHTGRHRRFLLGPGPGPPLGTGDGRPGCPRPARHVQVRGVLPPAPVRRHRSGGPDAHRERLPGRAHAHLRHRHRSTTARPSGGPPASRRPRGPSPGGTSRPPGWTPPASTPSPSWTTCADPAARSPAPSPSPAPPAAGGRNDQKRAADPLGTGNLAARMSRIPHQPARHRRHAVLPRGRHPATCSPCSPRPKPWTGCAPSCVSRKPGSAPTCPASPEFTTSS